VSDLTARGGESAALDAFELDGLSVEPRDGTISGPAARVRVDPQVMAVLVLLFHSANRVVSREALLEKVWPGRVVGDDALNRCIYQLRQHLSEAGGSGAYRSLIETLPKRGYRLQVGEPIADCTSIEPANPIPWKLFASLLLAIGVVVIGGTIWFEDRPAVSAPSTKNTQAADIVVTANDYFRRADRRTALPIAVALYEEAAELDPRSIPAWAGLARANTDLYAHSVDRTPTRLQRAEAAIERLVALDSAAPEARLAKAHYFLKGTDRVQDALQELEIAERSTPGEPDLFFIRAMAQRRLGNWGSAVEALDTALALDASNTGYLRQQFFNYQFLRDYDRAGRILERILELHPDDGTSYVDRVALALCRDGDPSAFVAYRGTAPSPYYDEGVAYTYTSWLAATFDRDYETALQILDGAAEGQIFDGDFRNASYGPRELFYARTHRLAGRGAEAREAYAAVVRLVEQSSLERGEADDLMLASRYLALAEAQAGLGLREAALQSLEHAAALIPVGSDAVMGPALLVNSVTRVLAPAGYHEKALIALRTYLGDAGHWSIEGLRKDPRLDELSRSPGFIALEKQYARVKGPDEDSALASLDPVVD
jgi:DNA-binding winged helix-turn-helix (wHTH) protein